MQHRKHRSKEEIAQIYAEYLKNDRPVSVVAAEFGLNSGAMLNIFWKHGLKERRPRGRISDERVKGLHQRYLSSDLPVEDFAKNEGLTVPMMYWLFRRDGLQLRRVTNSAPAPKRSKSFCPGMATKEFCGFCPCSVPPCDDEREWHCELCSKRCSCTCWDVEYRAQCGWQQRYDAWLERRARENKLLNRMERVAARTYQ